MIYPFLLSKIMIGDGDEHIFFNGDEFAVDIEITKQDGTVIKTKGIEERADWSENISSRSSHDGEFAQVTVATTAVDGVKEGDECTYLGITYVIVDDIPDGFQTTFTLSE